VVGERVDSTFYAVDDGDTERVTGMLRHFEI